MIETKQLARLTSIVLFIYLFSTIEVNAAKQQFGSNRSSKYIPLCSSEQRNFL